MPSRKKTHIAYLFVRFGVAAANFYSSVFWDFLRFFLTPLSFVQEMDLLHNWLAAVIRSIDVFT